MTKLIEELKRDHTAIVDMFDRVKEFGIASEAGQAQLLETKSRLLNHLKKEDAELYPALRKAAETNANLKQTMDLFAKDMEIVSKTVLDFFDKYSNGGSGVEFAMDFGRLFARLAERVRKEEMILYAEYEKLHQKDVKIA